MGGALHAKDPTKGIFNYSRSLIVGGSLYLNYIADEEEESRYGLARKKFTTDQEWQVVKANFGENKLLGMGFSFTLVDDYVYSIGSGLARTKRSGAAGFDQGTSHKFDIVCDAEIGSDDLTDNTFQLRILNGSEYEPFDLSHHIAEFYNNLIYMFGGMLGNEVTNKVFAYDTDGGRYDTVARVNVSGTPPLPRVDHMSCIAGHFLVVYGGRTSTGFAGQTLNDVFLLDLRRMQWSRKTGVQPARSVGAMCFVHRDKSIYVFGGRDEHHKDTNTVFRMQLKDSTLIETKIEGATLPEGPMAGAQVYADNIILTSAVNPEVFQLECQERIKNLRAQTP